MPTRGWSTSRVRFPRRYRTQVSENGSRRDKRRFSDDVADGVGEPGTDGVKRRRVAPREVPEEFAEARLWDLVAHDTTHGRWEARGVDGEPSAVWHSAMNLVALYSANPPEGVQVTDEHGVLHADRPVLEWFEVPMKLATRPIAYSL